MRYDVAIIIPIYNSESYIKECMESIIQNFNNKYKVQIVLIDDGSTDNTKIICKRYAQKYNNITYELQKNQGVSVARNKGINISDAEYIMFVDSDDYINKNIIEYCLDLMHDTEFLIGGYCTFDSKMHIEKKINSNFYGNISEFSKNIEKWIYPPYLLSPWGKIFKAEIIKKYNIKFLRGINYGEDAIFVINYLKKIKNVKSINKIIYNHRKDNYNSLSSGYKSNMIDCDILVNEHLEAFLKSTNNKDYRKICNKRFVVNFSGNIRKLILSPIPYVEKKQIFYEKSEKYNALEIFNNSEIRNLSEKITYIALKNRKLFFLLDLHLIKAKIKKLRRKNR